MTIEALAPNRLHMFTHDGLDFDVIDEGPLDGPVIVALHGFPERATCYRSITPLFTAAGFRVLAPTQRGYSPGARPDGIRNYTADLLAGDIIALADQAGASTFHVLGHDWGAAVAWQLAADCPERVLTLSVLSIPHMRAFLSAMLRGQVFRSWYIGLFQLPWLPERLFAWGNGWFFRRVLGPWADMPAAKIADSLLLMSDRAVATATINWYRAVRYRLHRLPGKICVPTLYIWSDRDAAIGGTGADRARRYVEAPYQFEVLCGVSHWIPDERPFEVATAVMAYIHKHSTELRRTASR